MDDDVFKDMPERDREELLKFMGADPEEYKKQRAEREKREKEIAEQRMRQWAKDHYKNLETLLESAEKMVKWYQDTIVTAYRERAEKADREAKEAQREATFCRNGWKKAEREKDAALKDLREAAWCMHCNNWDDMKKCMGLAKEGIRICVLCKEKCSCRDCEYGSKWKWRGSKEE